MPRQVFNVRAATACWALGAIPVVACSESHMEGANSQSHWLKSCRSDAECGGLSCLCGACNVTCDRGRSCAASLGAGASCQPSSSVAGPQSCASEAAATNICVVECQSDAECTAIGDHLRCQAGVCGAAAELVETPATMADASPSDVDAGADVDAATEEELEVDANDLEVDAALVDASVPTSPLELACHDGAPSDLPSSVTLLAQDVDDWSVSNHVLTTLDAPEGGFGLGTWSLRRLDSDVVDSVTDEAGRQWAGFATVGSDGALAVQELDLLTGVSTLNVRFAPEQGAPQSLARMEGAQGLGLQLDAQSVYWMARNNGGVGLWSAARTPGASTSLGAVPLAEEGTALGLVSIGSWLYAAINVDGAGRVVRAAKDGSATLADFGPALPAVVALTSDGTDLWLMLEGTSDSLGNPLTSARIARMTSAGTLVELTEVEAAGSELLINAGRIYWRANQNQTAVWNAALWSAPLDGSSPPRKVLTTPGNLLDQRLFSDRGDLFFSVYCRVDLDESHVTGRIHVLRLRP